jgi:IS5 family transposase
VVITEANLHDMKATARTLSSIVTARPKPTRRRPQNLCLDKGYDYSEIEREAIKHGCIPHIRHRREAAPPRDGRCHQAKRWVVERTGSWHNRFRKLLIRWEKKARNYLALTQLACCLIIYRLTVLGAALSDV